MTLAGLVLGFWDKHTIKSTGTHYVPSLGLFDDYQDPGFHGSTPGLIHGKLTCTPRRRLREGVHVLKKAEGKRGGGGRTCAPSRS